MVIKREKYGKYSGKYRKDITLLLIVQQSTFNKSMSEASKILLTVNSFFFPFSRINYKTLSQNLYGNYFEISKVFPSSTKF